MKKMLSMAAAAFLVAAAVSYSTKVLAQPEPEVTDAQVNARVDARLRQVLAGMILERAARAPAAAH
ncbi:MAG: hypothetical protein ACYC8T_31780 [Myxococcaceae bacterium]